MNFWSRADVAIRTAVFATVAAGAISAVAFDDVPLGAVIGVSIGIILAAVLMWPRKRKTTNERQ